ncbi:MAG: 1-aminocyclopropane-1-carboxylate deaminase/D-cysteine desulfhydrase, partial [Marinirhabdus sp.]
NLIAAASRNHSTLLTYGGAYSNHIAAVARAGKLHGFRTIGVIRGEELCDRVNGNPTLSFAKRQGMQLYFITRAAYAQKSGTLHIEKLKQKFGRFYLLPEGGTNPLAVKGCAEIISKRHSNFTHICVPVGTGGTMAGVVASAAAHQKVMGFSALQGAFQKGEIKKHTDNKNFEITDRFNFGGYAKINETLISFMNRFNDRTGIPLDPVYTSKMFFGIHKLVHRGHFPDNSRILAIHTGGLQGVAGMNKKLEQKNLPLLYV